MTVNAGDVPIDEVGVEFQHSESGVLIDKEAYVEGRVVGQARLARRHLVRVFCDDVHLPKPLVVDTRRPSCSTRHCGDDRCSSPSSHTQSCRAASSYRRLLPCRDRRLLCVGPRKPSHRNVGSTPPDGIRRPARHDPPRGRALDTTQAVVWRAGSSHRGNCLRACGVAST